MKNILKIALSTLAGLLLVLLLSFGYSYFFPPLVLKPGMCVINKNVEFPTKSDIHKIAEIGKDKLLLSQPCSRYSECTYEWEKYLIVKLFKEVPCNCDGLRSCD